MSWWAPMISAGAFYKKWHLILITNSIQWQDHRALTIDK